MEHDFDLPREPIDGVLQWLGEAEKLKVPEANAVTLSTVSRSYRPSSRIVYFKGLSESSSGVKCPRFFTNYQSQKSKEILEHPFISLLFYWAPQWRQIRVEGRAEKISVVESNAYFQTRARASRIGAWASSQSELLSSRSELEARVAEVEAKFAGQEIPCPPFWGGWRVIPDRFEFWQGGDHRLHDRCVFTSSTHGWTRSRLAP